VRRCPSSPSIAGWLIACELMLGAVRADPPLPSASVELRSFYERSYSAQGAEAATYSDWRALSAVAKAEHVVALTPELSVGSARVLDIGCGDGALIARLSSMRPRWAFSGVEIAERAVAIAQGRCQDADIRRYDGNTLPYGTGTFRLGILSHVLEHVADPVQVLREATRVCDSVLVEVPLEANASTLRASKKLIAREVGHIQRFSRRQLAAVATAAGLRVTAELSDPLGREAHAFYAHSPAARARANAKWILRAAVHSVSSDVAQRLFTVHYACRCEPASSRRNTSA
jgi:ubiquinone/menaquinone biosynthesis C-methylase UbiE